MSNSIKSRLAEANLSEDPHEAILQLADRVAALSGNKDESVAVPAETITTEGVTIYKPTDAVDQGDPAGA